MSWIEKLDRTYDNNLGNIANSMDAVPLLPLFFSIQNAQLEVVLDGQGQFLDATVVMKDDAQTIIPATEASAGRSGSKIAPHALCDTLQYVAGDYLAYGGNPEKKKNESGYEQYVKALQGWVESSKNCKLQSVLTYLKKRVLIRDLIEKKVLFTGINGKLLKEWAEPTDAPPIFKAIKKANKTGQYEAFVRFSVEIPGQNPRELWKDDEIRESWGRYCATMHANPSLCMVSGQIASIAVNHPKNIRYPGDGAKIISSNDTDGFTYLGRFTSDIEACCIGIEITQKAHSALRWLIARQGWRDGDQAIVAWAVSGAEVPDPLADTYSLLTGGQMGPVSQQVAYTAQEVGLALSKKLSGYAAKFNPTEDIVVMGLDSATPGRMAITFYRELASSALINRIETWHRECAWPQRFSNDRVFVGAPAPRDIAEAAFGKKLDDKLKRATVERILPCIIDGLEIPLDLVGSCVRRACNRSGVESWEWEKTLGIACALYKMYHKERSYPMALDRERKTRDYLFGRLLALAEHLESRALYVGGEKRATNAEKLMQRFADRPHSTWLNIETGLVPYEVRLGAKRSGFLYAVKQEIDDVMTSFEVDDFVSDKRLSGEFLLAYHCQRAALRPDPAQPIVDTEDDSE